LEDDQNQTIFIVWT